jgi:hypothetical protein
MAKLSVAALFVVLSNDGVVLLERISKTRHVASACVPLNFLTPTFVGSSSTITVSSLEASAKSGLSPMKITTNFPGM